MVPIVAHPARLTDGSREFCHPRIVPLNLLAVTVWKVITGPVADENGRWAQARSIPSSGGGAAIVLVRQRRPDVVLQ